MSSYALNVRVLVEAAIFATVAIVLSLLPTNIGSSLTISLGMIPLTLFALKRGFWPAILSGLNWGLLHFVIGNAYILDPLQAFVEYILAFAFGGFAGLYANVFQNNSQRGKYYVILATLVGTLARFFWHFVAGFIYWGQYAPEGWSPVIFSLIFNGASVILTSGISAIVLVILFQRYPSLFQAS